MRLKRFTVSEQRKRTVYKTNCLCIAGAAVRRALESFRMDVLTRRRVLTHAGQGILAASALDLAASSAEAAPQQASREQITQSQRDIKLPQLSAPTEKQPPPPPKPLPPSARVGYAIIGLGTLSVNEILPAFGECKMSRPVALVSGERDKALTLAAQYGINPQNVYDYKSMDRLRDNPDVQAVYIVLPNGQHEEFTVRSAQLGKHVLCEKPMANSSAEARRMISACAQANRKLMIAYRIQYEPYNREVRRLLRSGELGPVKLIQGHNGQNQGDPNQWRQKKALAGGGALPDIGLYCLNTSRFLLGEEPIAIQGSIYSTPGDPRFTEVEENCLWQMLFPSGVQASFMTGYGHHESRRYRALLDRGWVNMDAAFAYRGQKLQIARADGQTERVEERQLNAKNQFAAEMDHFSDCVLNNKMPFTPGEEGLQDQILMEAIYESARTNKTVTLPRVEKKDAFRGPEPTEA